MVLVVLRIPGYILLLNFWRRLGFLAMKSIQLQLTVFLQPGSLTAEHVCLKSLMHLSFRPGFSPATVALESRKTVLTVYSSSDLKEIPLSETVTWDLWTAASRG